MRVQNLTDGRLPTWRNGRTWVGRWVIQWVVPGRKLGFSIGSGFSFQILFLSLYVSRRDDDRFDRREFSIYWLDGILWIRHPWERGDGEWHSADHWWKKTIALHVVDWLIGKPKYTMLKGEPFETFVPMPEGSYRAKATPEKQTWAYRWYWPDRVRESVWLEIPGGISHSGKGESDYDCGDDGLCGIGGGTLEDAIANAVRSSLKSRRRYGHDSRGTGRRPAIVVNEEMAKKGA